MDQIFKNYIYKYLIQTQSLFGDVLYTEKENTNDSFNPLRTNQYGALITNNLVEIENDSQYKLGLCYRNLNNADKALDTFNTLLEKFPNSEYVKRTKEQINYIKKG